VNTLQVEGVGMMAPGLAGWSHSRAVLPVHGLMSPKPMPAPSPRCCRPTNGVAPPPPSNWRCKSRRKQVWPCKRISIQALSPTVYTVFASSGGDSEVLDKICTALTLPDRPVSPTHFHHSVHNTPAGYWSIATRCTQPSLSLSAYDDSFAAGLMEAAALAWTDQTRVLLIAYDLPLAVSVVERRRDRRPVRRGAAAESGADRAATGDAAAGNGTRSDRQAAWTILHWKPCGWAIRPLGVCHCCGPSPTRSQAG
jgi:hypothetical protein